MAEQIVMQTKWNDESYNCCLLLGDFPLKKPILLSNEFQFRFPHSLHGECASQLLYVISLVAGIVQFSRIIQFNATIFTSDKLKYSSCCKWNVFMCCSWCVDVVDFVHSIRKLERSLQSNRVKQWIGLTKQQKKKETNKQTNTARKRTVHGKWITFPVWQDMQRIKERTTTKPTKKATIIQMQMINGQSVSQSISAVVVFHLQWRRWRRWFWYRKGVRKILNKAPLKTNCNCVQNQS